MGLHAFAPYWAIWGPADPEGLDGPFDRGARQIRATAPYHAERNHQGLNNRIIEPGDELPCTTGKIACRERLGGMLRYYYRRAA